MRNLRFTLAGLMGTVLVAAVGLSALKNASETWAGVIFLVTRAVLGLAIVGAVCRRLPGRAWWLGFGVFGWGYLAVLASWPEFRLNRLPTSILLEVIRPALGVPPSMFDDEYQRIGHHLLALLAAVLGGITALFFFGAPAGVADGRVTVVRESDQPASRPRLDLVIAGLTVLVLIAALITLASRRHAVIWSAATFLLTCALIGLVCLGAILGPRRRRATCVGAALFGVGYGLLVCVRNPLHPLPTDQLLHEIRPWFSPLGKRGTRETVRVLDALERPIPMRFPNGVELDDLLEYVKKATSTPGQPAIPIFVTPTGLEGERSLAKISIDVEGVPLRTTLRLYLRQLGLDYSVQDGYLWIRNDFEADSDLEDPFLIVGHCLLALIAAGFGALLAPLVADASNHSTSSPECASDRRGTQ